MPGVERHVGAERGETQELEDQPSKRERRQLKVGPGPPFEETVTEFEPPRRIVYKITKGSPLRGHVGVMTFAPEGAGTRFHYDIRLASPIPLVAPLVHASLTRSIKKSLDKVEREA